MPDNRYYYFKDAKGNRHTVNKAAFDNDREGFAKAFPGARMEVIDRKTGRRGDVDVKDAGRVGDFGAHLFTGQTVKREKYQPKTSLGKAAQSVAQEKWGGKESELVKGLREADASKRRYEEQMPIDYTKPSAVKQMVGRTHREQQTLDRRIEQAGREAGKDVIKPLREKEARLKTPVVDTGDADINSHVINTQEQAERQLAESGLEFANKHLDDYVSSNIINEFKTATAKGAAAESALSKASPFSFMAAGDAYNAELDPDKLLKHLQEKANADITSLLSNPKMQAEIGLKAAAYGLSPEEYVEKSLIPGLQTKLAADFDKSELSRNMPKSTAEYILRGVNESMLGTIMSMGMTSKKQRQYAQQGMAMTDNGENPDVNPGMAARVARGTLGFVADAPVFGAAGKVGAAVAGKVFGNGVAQTARIANSTLGGRIARMAGSGMVSQGITGVLYGSTNAAVQNYSTGDDTSIGNTVKVMAMGGLSEGASWATMGGIGGVVGAGIYNVSGVKRIPAKAFQLAMEGIGMHMGGNVAKTIEGHDTDWLSVEGNLEACANVVALKLTHARLPKRQEKDGVKESYLDVVARNIKSLMTSDGQRAAFGGYTFTNEEKEQLFGSASAPKRNESIYGYDVHDNPLTRKESLTSWAMRAKKTAAKGKGEKDTDAEFVKTAYDEIMADNTIPWDTKAKFSALVMGTVPSERPMMENCRIEGGSVNEYSKNGELLSKNSFKSIDERNSIIYSLNLKREDQRLSNAYGAAQIKDEKTAQTTLEAVAEANGMTAEQLKTAMDKQPLRRSEEEQNACVALRKAYEDEQFVPGTLHAEQSNTEGKDVVEENGLGTETPNNEAVAEVLGDLTKAEDALQTAMDGNDVLKEEYERMQKAGMSNPQIYMELFNSGLTQEQLAPLADYINALSKAQGMFKGTQDKIVETTQKHVGQWSYKDELNGEKQNGEQMLFVKDNKGRVLIVGAGDVAFDNEGRARESVGDMLSVLDPATMEMDFVSKKDVQLDHTEKTEDYAKNYQTMLEVKNSEVYAQNEQQKQMEKKPENLPKGRKQVVRSLSLLDKVSSPKDKLNEIRRIEQNVELGEKGAITPEEQAHVDEVLAELKEQGYEMDNEGIVGSEFRNNGRNDIIVDNASVIEPGDPRYDKLEDGQTVIDKIIKPKILKDGKIYQPATVTIMFRADTSVSERLYEAKRELAGMLKADESNEIVQRKIAETKAEIAELEKKKAEELASKPQQNPTNAGYEIAKTLKEKIGGSLSEEEATNLVGEMESRAEEAHDMPLTPENWEAEFGEDGKVQTPLGEVKMGKNQLVKLFERGRSKEFGMIKPTLSDPDVVIEVPSEAKDGKAERDTSLLFIKTFKKPNGEKVYYFKSVTIKKDGIEISISSHYDRRKRVEEALKNGKLLYLKQGDAQTEQSQLPVSGTTFREIIAGLNGKDSNNSANGNGNNETLTFADGSPVPMKKDSKNRDTADYSQMTPEQGAEWIKTRFGENADGFVDGRIKRAEKAVKAAEKIKVDLSGEEEDVAEALAARKTAIESAEKELNYFTAVKNVMKQVEAAEAAAGGEGATGNRYEQWRKDGYHIGEGGVRYDRQKKEDMTGVYGKDVKVDFTPTVGVNGRAKVVEVDSVQASHVNGQVNPMHFGPDWQPKDRTDDASKAGQDQALKNFDPEKITGDGNAFIGSSPSVNERHEAIQGNNRVEILRRLYDEQPEKAAQYKQWLIDHAEEYGLDAAEIAKMKKPILVNELPVDDAKALELGQYRASDFESGGKELPRTSVVINRLGDKMQNVANIMLRQGTLPEDAKMSDLVSQNATKVLDYLVKEGVVSATEEQTLRKDSTAMRQWMGELLKTGLFEGDKETEAAFNQLPDNARRAVLATYLRDAKSGDEAKIKRSLQRSFEAYSRMMNNPAFVNAKNVEEARAAVSAEIEKGNNSLFGEEPIRELFSNFELELAALYKGLKDQKTLTGLLNKYFDAVQGDKVSNRQLEIGEEPRDAISKEEALKEVFGLHESKPAETQNQVDKAVKNIATEITKKTGIEVVTDEKEAEEVIRESEETDSDLKYHKETDEATLEELENGETVKVYRAMQVIDGKLYPPMAAAVNGKRVEANELGTWIRADENPDLAIPDIDPKTKEQKVDKKTGELKWKFKLDKGGKDATGKKATDIPAAYNPYWHTSRSPLNDQFKSAWIRPNIVVVECEVPVSELSSGYRAERAKDAVGEVDWKSGVVSGEVYKQTGRARKVILSRWCKPVRVLSDAEVAQRAKEFVGDAKVEIPENVLTPKQRIEFEKVGFKIGAPEKGVKKSDQINEALKRGLQIDNSVKEFRTKDGEVYGFTDGKKIYLDTKKMKPETPLHEYAHLWCDMLRKVNPKEWENVKKLFDKVEGLKEEVKKLYPELEGDALYEEMITTYSGREGTKKLEDVVRKLAAEEGKSVTESAKAQGFLAKVKEALTKYWKGVADVLGIHFTTAEEVADKVLADWAKGVDPRESEEGKEKSEVSESKVEGNEPSEASLGLPKPLGEKGAAEPLDESASAPVGEEPLAILPKKEDNTFNPIVKAAENYKKDHPLTEGEIRSSDVDDIAKDMAVDYLNGEVTDDLHRAVYESIYGKVKDAKMKNAAEKFAKEKEAATEAMGEVQKPQQKADDAAVEASNKKVNDLWNDLLKAGREDLSASFIGLNARQLEVLPKLVSAMAENAYLRIKRGMHNLEDVVKEMRKEFAPAAQVFKKEDVDAIYEQMMNIRYRDGEQRMSLKEWADYYEKSSPKHKEELVGDSKEAEDRKISEKKFIDKVNHRLGFGQKINGIVELRKMAEECGLKDVKDTDLQELAETAIVRRARGIASSASTNDAKKFELIKKLYENQPSLNQRDSERVMKQQYSTPAPYAFLADMYVKAGMEVKSALEPSAGNGMLTIGLPKDAVHVNDIDAQRLANLQRQGFKNITSQDGTQPFADKDVDVVVTNPPFGSATPKEYDGYKISSLEGQMAINALESMKDNGRAAIIIGGKTEYAKNGSLTPKDKALLGYLYSHYNVEDVINVDGSLYAKQGTTYPTRIILINGRRYDENAYPPVKDKARAEAVKSYDELYKRINDDILRSGRMDSPVGEGGEKVNAEPDKQGAAGAHEEGLRMGQSRGGKRKATDGSGGIFDEPSVRVPDDELGNGRRTGREPDGELHNGDSGADTTGTEPTQSEGRGNNSNRHGVGGSLRQPGNAGRTNTEHINNGPSTVLKPKPAQERSLSTEKVGYAPKSENPFTLQSVMPADQQEAVNKNLEKLGDADQFLVDELGYNDKDDLYSHLAAEQVDSVALAIQQAKKGNAFIIGDMTGIGKGRQAASLIRYAKKQGQVPVYFTKTAGLLSDVYRDLVDIGSPELRPFVFGSSDEAKITDSDGKVVYKLPTKEEKERVIDYIEKNGKLPEEYDYVLTTYSQVGNGVYEFDENDNRKERKLKKGDKFGPSHFSGQARRDAIEKLISNGYLILDESHTAGGQSNQGNYFQHIIQKAKNVTFFSATFAKRPDNMPIYALRTAMNEGGMKASDLIDAVKRGGATLQEIMSQTLTQCGQMIRRERDMTGVTIDWKPIDDPVVVSEQREQYDKTIELFNDIINFQKNYVMPYIDERNEELAAIQATIGLKKGTKALGIASTPFASKAFNTVQQVLLSLKAKEAAKRAIDYLKQGVKPVIALNNTNESQSGEIKENEEVEEPDLGTSLKKGLAGTLRYTKKDSKNNADSGTIDLASLGDEAVNAYNQLMTKIEHASTGLALSPIDVIKNELQKAGYKVGELTGRKTQFIYNDNGSVSKVKRTDTDKKKLAREFNDGSLDALILNKSASTGISLHASSKFNDQRKRVMIVAQQQLDVNDEVQMRGRIDRTGQVQRGAYEYIVSQIPAEQRLLMMFKAKLKSLDANTTSSQKSKFNEMEVADITNKYGDRIVKEYMAEHLDLYSRMADPFGWEKNGADLYNIDSQKLINSSGGKDYEDGQAASKLLGRMALLRVNEQEKMLQEIGDLYAAEIQRLNEMGENDLEITELPLKAKTINKGIWKEGSEPGGDNAFADNTYVEKVNMAVLKKPMKAEEVKKAQDGLTGSRSWDEYRKEKITAAKEYFDNKITEATEKYEERAVKTATKAKEKYIKDAKKAQKDTGMSDEQIEKMAGYQYDSVYGDEKTKLDEVVKNLKSKYGVFERALETFNTDDAFVLPTDMNNPAELSGFGNSYGRLIDIKITDNFSPNASTISFATLDGRRKITFPINGKVGIGSDKADVIGIIDRLTRQASAMGDKHLRVLSMDASNWDKLTSNESRKDGYIITGNLLQALIDTKEQGLGGQLVKYTTDTGEVKTGILMPEKFEPKGLANDKPINSVAEKFELPSNKGGITEITSSDGDVKIEQGFDYMKMARNYTIRVPKSNKKGGKYFLDKELLKMVDGGNFETRGNTMLAEVKADKLKDVLDRLSELGVKVREESEVHYRTDASLSLSKPLEGRIAETVEKVSKQTGGKVKMVNSVEEIGNEEVRRDIENGKQVTGWYDENTGEVHLYMPNIHDSYTAEKTVWHETVGHKGMRGLLGDKFNDYMRGLWLDLDNPVNAELRAYVKERMGKDSMGFYDAIEEFIAESAEKGKGEPGFWNYIKNKVTDALHEIGYRISPNVKDVKYMLWLAKNVQKKGNDPWWKMRADAVKWKIEHENVEYTKIHGGEFYENDGKNHDFEDMTKEEWDEATDGQIHYRTAPSAATALDRYHKMLDAHGYMATEAFMDNMLSLEKLMKAVDPSIKKIEDVNSSMNPYVLQNTMQGAMSDKMTLFEHQVMKPLDKAMSDVLDSFDGKNTEEKIRECNLYMIGKHGLERNRVLFVRDYIRGLEPSDAESLQRQWNAEKKDLGDKLRNGDIDLKEYYESMDEWIRNNVDMDFKAEEHDYSGMHGLQEIDDLKSPYDDAGAIDSVMSQEAKMENQKKGSVDNLWKRIKDATNYSVYSDYENGLISEELRDHVTGMFDWYVPLRKYDEATAEDIYGYISGDDGKGFIGETLMSAKGRKSLSDVNVLAQIGAMGNRAIRNGGQNAIKQAFVRFVRNSGEQNLVKETKVWVEKKGTDMNGNDIWEEAYPQIPDNASAHDIATIVDAFETDMKTKQAKGEAKTLSNSTDIGFKFARAKNKSEHFVDVKIAGRTHRFVVLGNPRAAQALNGMLENSSPNSALLKGLKSTTRFMAQMATSYSPEFVMRNIIRDAEFASSNVTAKEGVMYGKKWLRYYAELNPLNVAYNEGAGALKSLKWKDLKEGVGMGLYARYREGTLGNSKMERYFKEFMQNGGETGWVQVKTMQEWEKDYKRDVSREHSKVAKTGKALRDFLVGNVENLNEVAENMARFATFCTSRDLGRSAVRSAYDAKQVSTNFNRHGSGDAIKTFKNGEMGASKEMRRNVYGTIASYLRNYSMFFNAGVQSTHLLMSNVKKAPVGTVASMMAMPFGLGIMAAVLNNAMIASEDEKKRKGVKDPYGELPEYIRRNNLCIYKGGGEFVTIPLAIELRAFYGLGDIAAGMTAAKNVKSTRNVAKDAVGCMSQLLPVVDFMNSATFDKEPGKELLKGVLPTAAAPFAEWWLNSDWKGAPIRREGDYTENRPAWMNAYSGTPEKLMDLNKWVNAKTNDVAPGNENMRGNSLLDEATDPAMLNHIIGTLGGGAATFITRGTGLVLKYADGREQEIETKDIPFLRSLLYTPSEQTSMARTKAKWYGYKESMEKSTSNYSMLKNKNVPLTERIRNAADRHRFEQGADYARIRIIKDAEKQMKHWNKMKRLNADDKKQVDFANKNIEMIMQKAVEQMDRIED